MHLHKCDHVFFFTGEGGGGGGGGGRAINRKTAIFVACFTAVIKIQYRHSPSVNLCRLGALNEGG